jgi:RNA-splicing ligase RtcB
MYKYNLTVKELKRTMNKGISKEFLQGEYLFNYLIDMCFTQHYAKLNRQLIIDRILQLMNIQKVEQRFDTIHNYVDFTNEDFMIRKGAISAKKDELALIPLSMKDGVLLVRAKGNPEWNYSLNHGAGRLMSRSKAKELISFDDVKTSMNGIVCDLNENVIDESVFAYKDANVIMNAINDNAEIISLFKPILNLKDIGKVETWKEKNANRNRK